MPDLNIPPRLVEIRTRLAELQPAIATDAAVDKLDEAGETRFAANLGEWDTLTAEAAPLEERQAKVEAVAAAALRTGGIETGADETRDGKPEPFNVLKRTGNPFDLTEVRHLDPDSRQYATEMRARAEKAIEMTAEHHVRAIERAYPGTNIRETALVHADNPAIARHILRYGSEAYAEAFRTVLGNPVMGMAMIEDREVRAAMAEGATTTGGFMVPPMLDPTIILTNNGITNPIRGAATVKTIATQTWKGVTSAGVTAEWTAEAATAADASPTVAQPSITPVRADAWVQASFEVNEDTNIASEIAMLMADAKDRLEGTAFAVGTGSTQPNGIITAIGGVTASRVAGSSGAGGAADFVLADVYAVANALPPRYRPNASWLAEQTIYNKVRRFGEGTTANAAFWADLGVAIPSLLLGRPALESSAMDNTIVSGSNDDVLLLGDISKYYVVDRVGMSLYYEPLLKAAGGQRPTGEVGWFAFWRVGGDMVDTNAARLLRL